jgi:hypothetical protein
MIAAAVLVSAGLHFEMTGAEKASMENNVILKPARTGVARGALTEKEIAPPGRI